MSVCICRHATISSQNYLHSPFSLGLLLSSIVIVLFLNILQKKLIPDDKLSPTPSKKPRPAASTSGSTGVKEIVFSFDTTGSMYPCLTQV